MEAARRALGAKPSSLALRKATALDEDGAAFFQPLPGGPSGGESVADYAASLSRSPVAQGTVVLVPVGGKPELVAPLAGSLAAFLHPQRVDVRASRKYAPGQVRIFRDPRSPGKLSAEQLTLSLERDLLPGDACVIGVCLASCSRPTARHERVVLVDVHQAAQEVARQTLCRAAMSTWARLQPCRYLQCAMNAAPIATAPFVLCPVCLRKLSLALAGALDVTARYRELFSDCSAHGAAREAQWYAERLAFLGDFKALEELDKRHEASASSTVAREPPERGGDAVQSETAERERMARGLASLKARMKTAAPSHDAPIFG